MIGLLDLAQKDNDNEIVRGDSNDRNFSKSKKLENAKSKIQTYIEALGKPTFLTPSAMKAFNQLR